MRVFGLLPLGLATRSITCCTIYSLFGSVGVLTRLLLSRCVISSVSCFLSRKCLRCGFSSQGSREQRVVVLTSSRPLLLGTDCKVCPPLRFVVGHWRRARECADSYAGFWGPYPKSLHSFSALPAGSFVCPVAAGTWWMVRRFTKICLPFLGGGRRFERARRANPFGHGERVGPKVGWVFVCSVGM